MPFAIYSLPYSNTYKLIIQKDYIVNSIEILDIEDVSGFVIADFNSAHSGTASLIAPDIILSKDDLVDKTVALLNKLPDRIDANTTDNVYTTKSDYLDIASYIIKKLVNNDLRKVVLSRVVKKTLSEKLKASVIFNKLYNKYNNAFAYLFYLPEKGTWCGASPEALFKVEDSNIVVDALAGTRLLANKNTNPHWTIKEKEEQSYVTLYIKSLLSELGIDNYKQSDPITITAGNLAHIQSKFSIPVSEVNNKVGKIIAGLHPTPAVCGLPKADSFLLIKKAERHQRRYYTGFLGPWNVDKKSQLYVNLRCAELDTNYVNIYVGGGLTAASVPEAEFEETVHKTQTLLSVVENL